MTAYALDRPDGTWSVLIVNKDTISRAVTVQFDGPSGAAHFRVPVTAATSGREQYQWNGRGPADEPHPDAGIRRYRLFGTTQFQIAPESLTVLRGNIGR